MGEKVQKGNWSPRLIESSEHDGTNQEPKGGKKRKKKRGSDPRNKTVSESYHR